MKPLVVLKIGGAAAEAGDGLAQLAVDIALLSRQHRLLVVHGGGAELTRLSERLGLQPVFRDGVRMTSAAEMDLVDMVLAGMMNKRVVRALSAAGVAAVGLCGSDGPTFTGTPLIDPEAGATRTGTVDRTNPHLLEHLQADGYVPVLSSVCDDRQGHGLNVNADTVALHLAQEMQAASLVFLSDIPGVLKDGSTLAALTPRTAQAEIHAGTIQGGMVPKIRAAIGALNAGVAQVVIGCHDGPGSLEDLLEGSKGTTFSTEQLRAGGGRRRTPHTHNPNGSHT